VNTGTGVIHDADAFSGPYYRLAGERLERIDDNVYRVRRGVFTTCEDDPPTWSVHVDSATADFDGYLTGRNASVWVKRVPVIPFVPYFAAALRRERQTGFLFPTVGNSSRKGFIARVPFYWAISDNSDLTVSLDGYTERGPGGSAEFRYVLSERQQGTTGGFFVYESALDDDVRGAFRVRHNWTIDPTLSLRADINHASDDDVFREYGDELFERSLERVESHVFLSKRGATWNFVADLFWYQDLATERRTELQRLPDLRLTSFRQPMPGLPRLLWEFESRATNFVRAVGSEGPRLDLHPRVTMPFRPLGLFTVAPFVAGRLTAYDRRVVGTATRFRERLPVEVTEDEPRARLLGEAGVDLEAQASRVYDVGRAGIGRVLHLVEPRVNYTFIDGVNKRGAPQFDEVDAIGRTNTFRYSLTNRLVAKTVAGPGETAVKWELARFVVANAYDADADDRPFADVTADLILNPTRRLRLRADAALSPYSARVRAVNSDVGLTLDRFAMSVGSRFNENADVEFYRGQASARVARNLGLRGSLDWDARRGEVIENRLGADVLFQCWAFALTYVRRARDTTPAPDGDRETDHEFRVSLDLLGVGTLQTGSTFAQ
jgi:LPS-assembly protein